MSDTKAQRLADALNDFISASHDVEAAAIVSYDGLVMASALPADMDEERLGAMSAALLSLGEQAAGGLGRGDLSQIFVEGEHGFVFLMSAKEQAVLAAITSKHAKIGFMLFEMRRAAGDVGTLLEERPVDTYVEGFDAVEPVPSPAPVRGEAPPQPSAPAEALTFPEAPGLPAPEPFAHQGAVPFEVAAPQGAPASPGTAPYEEAPVHQEALTRQEVPVYQGAAARPDLPAYEHSPEVDTWPLQPQAASPQDAAPQGNGARLSAPLPPWELVRSR